MTQKGEIAQFSLLADEGKETYEFCFKRFKDLCVRDPPIIIIDKVRNVTKTNIKIFNFIAYEQDNLTGWRFRFQRKHDWIFANTLQTNGTAD